MHVQQLVDAGQGCAYGEHKYCLEEEEKAREVLGAGPPSEVEQRLVQREQDHWEGPPLEVEQEHSQAKAQVQQEEEVWEQHDHEKCQTIGVRQSNAGH